MKRPALAPLPIADPTPPESDPTPDRLVAAAGEIFAEHGFQNATVREICQRAKANIAAVNYHFGDKRGLYHAVFHYAHHCATADLAAPAARPRDRLRAYVHAFLSRILDEGRPAWHGKLMAREMVEPTGVLDDLVERSVKPRFEALQRIIRDLLPAQEDAQTVRRCAISIVGQCVFYRHSHPILTRLDPDLRFSGDEIAKLAHHISEFSLKGLGAFSRKRAVDSVKPASARRAG